MSSLSQVVSTLLRASMGSAVSSNVADEDLDRHVAEIILKEAKEKAVRYDKDGIRAYLQNSNSQPALRANKRFLSSIIRSTDDHNKTVLKAQTLAAQEIKLARELLERKERRQQRLTAENAASTAGRWNGEDDILDSVGGENGQRGKGRMRGFSDDEDEFGDNDDDRRSGRSHDGEPSTKRRRYRSKSPISSRERSERDSWKEEDKNKDWRSRQQRAKTRNHDDNGRKGSRSLEKSTRARARTESPGESYDVVRDGRRRRHGKRATRDDRPRHRSPRSSPSPARRSRSPPLDNTAVRLKRRLQSPHLRSASTPVYAEKTASSRRKLSRSRTPLEKRPPDDASRCQSNGRHRTQGGSGNVGTLAVRTTTPSTRPGTPNADLAKSSQHRPQVCSSVASSISTGTPQSSESHSCLPPPLSPPPPPPSSSFSPPPPSKMDKYFEKSYDPRLDVSALTIPTVPAHGLIDESQFEDWDAMLELIRLRRRDKHEKKKQQEKSETGKNSSKKGDTPGPEDQRAVSSLMNIEYKKKGSVREWDVGKRAF